MDTAKQRILRAPKRHSFTVVDSRVANDKRLSWEARGVLFYILTKPDNWEVQPGDLMNQGNLRRDGVYRVLKELELAGYLERVPERNVTGQVVEWTTIIHETPLHTNTFATPVRKRGKKSTPLTDIPEVGTDTPYVDTDSPDTAAPYTENPHINKDGIVPNTESITNTESPAPTARTTPRTKKGKAQTVKTLPLIEESGTPPPGSAAPPSPHQAIMSAYGEALGYPIRNGGMEGKAAKWLVNNGYTAEQVAGCYRDMKASEFWSTKHLSLQKVSEQIGAWVQRQRPARPPQPAAPEIIEGESEADRIRRLVLETNKHRNYAPSA